MAERAEQRIDDALSEIDQVMGRIPFGDAKKTGMQDAKEIVQKHTGRTPVSETASDEDDYFWCGYGLSSSGARQ